MKTLADRLNFVMKEAGINQSELAVRIGIKQQAISRMLTGVTKNSRYFLPICNELSVSPKWLMEGIGNTYTRNINSDAIIHRIPLLTLKQVLNWPQNKEQLTNEAIETWWEISSTNVGQNGYAIRVRGDGMEGQGHRCIYEGCILIVESTSEYESGDLVIAKLPTSSSACFKQIVDEADATYLKSFNPSYPMIKFENGKVLGVVRQAIYEYY
ncbi:LexA family transcriptional regulator [Shewanella sp. 202IG2-18]|uniref:LexA family protein n=1 Tax=Parashewanella hymeniacidonis TaxID=2807618 RepID=UPI00195F43CF|nr:XRE family transcriptional regulator [Parashewanella hymeniacidonis]MBM7072418.1 LexA family transcriptional regulator [Parashewanella hymeniacidonis]